MTADKFGFYQVGNLRTFSKMEAFELEKRTGKSLHWNFNEEIFSSINWKQEPTLDLWSMYKSRARQIRNQYDYVVLFYSGGSDSHNILNAWIDADCKIDEIATMWNYEASADKLDFMNAEITTLVLPDIKLLQDKGFEFKYRLIDISQMSLDLFDVFGLNFEHYTSRYFSPNNCVRGIFRDKIDDYKNMIAAGKKVAFVWGAEKPIINYDGKYYLKFSDIFGNCVSSYVQERYNQGWYDELFFWSPDAPLIPVKQAHVIKNFIQLCNDTKFYQDKRTEYGFNKTLNKYLTEDTVKKLIYPKWDTSTFSIGKGGMQFLFSLRDQWIWDSNLELKNRYNEIIKHVVTNAPIKNRNIISHSSPKYYLE